MPKQATHVSVVREWLLSLGVLSAASATRQEAQMKLAAYVPLLLARFPDAAFTTASLEYVAARAVKGFPTYGELAGWLSEWWMASRPPLPALPPPDLPPPREPPSPEMVAHVSQVVAETVAFLRSHEQPDSDRRTLGAKYLSPGVLDQINPLPNGRKRAHVASHQHRPANDPTPEPPAAA